MLPSRAEQDEKRDAAIGRALDRQQQAVAVATVEQDGHRVPVLAPAQCHAFHFTPAQRKAAIAAHRRGEFVPTIVEVCRHEPAAIKII